MKNNYCYLILLFLCSSMASLHAKDIYVSDSGQLATACSEAASGDVIFLSAGTYTGPFVLNNKSDVTLRSYNGTVYMEGSPFATTSGIAVLKITNSSTISVQNLVFRNNWGNLADGIKVSGYGDNISVSGCEFYDIGWTTGKTTMPDQSKSAHAIVVVGSTPTSIKNVYIGNNNIHDCITGYSESVTLVGNVEFFLVEGNRLNGNTNIGIDAAGHFSWTGAPDDVNYARSGIIRGNTVSNYAGPEGLDAAGGIYTDGGSYNLIENNTVFNYKVGFSIGCEVPGKTANGNILRSNLAYNCSLSGLFLGSNTTSSVNNSEVYNNTFYKCGTGTFDNGQIALQNNSGSTIKNNILYPTDGRLAMVQMTGTSSNSKTQAYNLYWRENGNTTNLFFNVNGETNTITQNPLFADPSIADFTITDSSPAVNAGDPYYTGAEQVDLAGNSRIRGSRVDIGAFETAVPAEDTTPKIIIDGEGEDWSEVAYSSTTGSGGIESIKVVDNTDYIYISLMGNLDVNYQLFLDTDNSSTAGDNEYLHEDWPDTGFDFMIENGYLLAHTGQGPNWSWMNLGPVSVSRTASFLEMAIHKFSLESLCDKINIGAKNISSAWSTSGHIPVASGPAISYTLSVTSSSLRQSMGTFSSSQIKMYPNPLKDRLYIRMPITASSSVEVGIYNLQGRLETADYNEMMTNNDGVMFIDIPEELKPGLHVVRVIVDGKTNYSQLVTVMK